MCYAIEKRPLVEMRMLSINSSKYIHLYKSIVVIISRLYIVRIGKNIEDMSTVVGHFFFFVGR